MTALAAASARVAAPARVLNRRAVVARASSAPPSSSAASSAIASRRSLVAGTAALVASNAALVRAAFADGDEEYRDGPDGIKFIDLAIGKGEEPFEGDTLKANYQLNVNGKKVDYAKFFVFSIGTGEVIRGWETIVVGGGDMTPMRVGSKRKAMIPPELAYGAKGAGCGGDGVCRIPPGSTLEFTIELVGIV